MAGLALRKRFTCFQKLPLEVRLLIWEAALPGPRLVSLCQRRLRKTYLDYKEEKGHDWPPLDGIEGDEEELSAEQQAERNRARRMLCPPDLTWYGQVYMDYFWQLNMLAIDSDCPSPDIMLVCREAYNVVARHYTKAFAYPGTLPGAHIDFGADTLYLRDESFASVQEINELDGGLSLIQGLKGHYAITDTENLGRVQSLAVYISEIELGLPIDELLCNLLVVFSGVKELLLVAEDYNTVTCRDYPSDSAGQGSFIDPVDPVTAIKAYSSCRQALLTGVFSEPKLLMHSNTPSLDISVTLANCDWECTRDLAQHREFPNVRVVNIVPRRLKRDLDRARELYDQALAIYRVKEDVRRREELHAAGFCTDDALSDDEF